ncbi:MAG: RNA polymerase sigma factor [Solirubrobacteraceae bacterium]
MEDRRRQRLEALFVEHGAAVRAYVLRRGDPADADDVVMEVFVIACRRLGEMPVEPLPWLLGCARRILANRRRGARRARALIEKLSLTIAGPEHGTGVAEMLAGALNALSETDREVLLLAAWEGLAPSQIAQVVGCSRTAAAVRLHRARRRLRTAMSGAEAVPARKPAAEVLR